MLGMHSLMLWTQGTKTTLHINLKAPCYLEQTLGLPAMAERWGTGRDGKFMDGNWHLLRAASNEQTLQIHDSNYSSQSPEQILFKFSK